MSVLALPTRLPGQPIEDYVDKIVRELNATILGQGAISSATDVKITTIADGQYLRWDASLQRWINVTLASFAPDDAEYFLGASSSLANARLPTNTATIEWDVSTPNQFAANVPDAAIANAKLANMATARLKGRATAGSGAPEDLTSAQATALLDVMVGDSGAGGTKGLVPAPAAGDADKFFKGDGTYGEVAQVLIGAGEAFDAAAISPSDVNTTIYVYDPTVAPDPASERHKVDDLTQVIQTAVGARILFFYQSTVATTGVGAVWTFALTRDGAVVDWTYLNNNDSNSMGMRVLFTDTAPDADPHTYGVLFFRQSSTAWSNWSRRRLRWMILPA